MYRSNRNPAFRSKFSEDIFHQKYAHEGAETWDALAHTLTEDVCRDFLPKDLKLEIERAIAELKFIPGGRYLYYAGRPIKAFNNCFLLRSEEDTREDWANLSWKSESCLMTGGGIGNNYSAYREKGALLKRTGGVASGPLSKAAMIDQIGRFVMQGGSRRSAMYASLDETHPDAYDWIFAKDWRNMPIAGTGMSVFDVKQIDFTYNAPFEFTNMSLNWGDRWLESYRNTGDVGELFETACGQALMTGEPGWSFNFGAKANETLRNACTEVTSEDDSDVCNLASLNMSRIESLEEFKRIAYLGSMFLLCGTLVADLPYEKVYAVREKNRRLGLGLMGMHEWLVQRGYRYEVTEEMHAWLAAYRDEGERGANELADRLGVSRPKGYRAIAPTGTIAILAGTTSGIEPIFAVAYKRRYLKNGTDWHYQYVVDNAAQDLIDRYDIDPTKIESALDLAGDYERRMKFQADVQDYVDMSISSTINMPAWGTELNNESTVGDFTRTLAKYAHRLRGFTIYPDGARGGQPLTAVDYETAKANLGQVFRESVRTHDVCDLRGGGVCGI